MTSFVCLGEDDFTRELECDRKTALWLAGLSDGTTVVMDDGRPGVEPHSAWLRLAEHCRTSSLRIVRLGLKFRSNEQRNIMPANADGYFFCKSALGMFGSDETIQFYLLGYLLGDTLRVYRWSVPALILLEEERRDPDKAGECLIRS